MRACMCKHVHACACICMRVHACACMFMRVHACACVCLRVHACACVFMRVHAYTCARTPTQVLKVVNKSCSDNIIYSLTSWATNSWPLQKLEELLAHADAIAYVLLATPSSSSMPPSESQHALSTSLSGPH